jgi:ribonuclease P protein component
MLPKQQRFHTQGSVRRVMQHGQPVRGRHMMIRSIDSKHPASRIAVVVSKKVYKSAVKRNRIRRRIYNIVRHEIAHTTQVKDMTITVFSPEILLIDFPSLEKELKLLFQTSIKSDQ